MKALLLAASFLGAVFVAAIGELVSDEIRARLDRIPLAVLAAAARRLAPELRADLYGCAWLPELQHILRGERATPITRLYHGFRFAVRLWLSAPQIARELSPGSAPRTNTERMARFVFAPSRVVSGTTIAVPFASLVVANVVHHPTWFNWLAIVGALAVVVACPIGIRIFLAWRYKWHPEREQLCQCRRATVCRGLVIPTSVVASVITAIVGYMMPATSSNWQPPLPITIILVVAIAARAVAAKLGFGRPGIHAEEGGADLEVPPAA